MTDTPASDPAAPAEPATPTRTPWVAPRIQTIAAGEAEEGTRGNVSDGTFTTS